MEKLIEILEELQPDVDFENTNDLVDSITDIVDSHIFKSNKPKDLKQIEKKLILSGWYKTFTPLQYKAVHVFLKLVEFRL